MKLVKNTGTDRVIDELRRSLVAPSCLDFASSEFSLFAYAELRDLLDKLDACRIVLPNAESEELGLTGSNADRAFRNRLQLRWLARECGTWIRRKAELRIAPGRLPQSILIGGVPESEKQRVITGNCAFTTEGLGITPGTRNGKDMSAAQDLLATAVASVVGKKEERAIASLFTPGGTHAMKGEFQGINDFEVVAFLVVLPEKDALPEASGT